MTTSFFLRSINSDLSVGGALFNRKLLEDTAGAAGQEVSTGANETVDAYAFTEPGVPGPDGSAGDYTVSIHITAGATQINVSARLARVNSSGAVQAESGFSTPDAGNAGVKVHEFGTVDLGAWQAGDRLRVQYRFVNTDSMMARSLTIELNTVETELITPWAGEAEPVTGTLAVTEQPDTLSSSGEVTNPPVDGAALSTPVTTLVTTQTFTADLPAGTAVKLLVVALDAGSLGDETLTTPTGWVQVGPWFAAGGEAMLAVFHSDGETADTSVEITVSTKAELGACNGYILAGADLSTLTAGTATSGTGEFPAPPPVATSPPGLVIALMCRDSGVWEILGFPSGYTHRTDEFRDNVTSGAVGGLAALKVDSGTSEAPGTFTVDGSDEWAAQTLFVADVGGAVAGTLAVTEADDTLAASGTAGTPTFTGSLAATEADDSLAASGTTESETIAGSVNVTEQDDALAASGTFVPADITGTLAVTEQNDTLTAAGTHGAPTFTGSLGVQEESDTLAASGETTTPTIVGTLAVTEQDDTLVAAGGGLTVQPAKTILDVRHADALVNTRHIVAILGD